MHQSAEARPGTYLHDVALNAKVVDHDRALLHALLQATDYGVLVTDLNRQDLAANRRLGELFGLVPDAVVSLPPEQVRAQTRRLLRHPEAFEARLTEIYADPLLVCEDELELATHPPRFILRHSSPVYGKNASPVARLWTFLDVTESRHLRLALEASLQARTDDLEMTTRTLQTMNDICRLAASSAGDLEIAALLSRSLPLSPGFSGAALLLPQETGDALTAYVDDRTAPVDLAGESAGAWRQWLSAEGSCFDGPVASLDLSRPPPRLLGREIAVLVPLGKLPPSSGVMLLLGTASPRSSLAPYQITHLRALAEQMALALQTHQLQRDLRQALDALMLTQQQLIEAEKLRAAATVAASIAHDIRNILTPLKLALSGEDEGSSRQSIGMHVERFLTLTHQLMSFSRPDVLDVRPTQIADVVERVAALLQTQAAGHGVTIRLMLPTALPALGADAGQLEHLLANLCLNAIQAMGESGGTLTIEVGVSSDALTISVSDTGGGIAREVQPRLFAPFFTTRSSGTGLGLFSCRRIVEQHGGTIAFVSTPPSGTTFTVRLPLAEGLEPR